MFTVSLEDLQFHSFHGLHPEERILGNRFVVNVAVGLKDEGLISTMKQTVDYEALYTIIKKRMQAPTPLLETLAGEIADSIMACDSRIQNVNVKIKKKYPPISGIEGSVCVSCSKVS